MLKSWKYVALIITVCMMIWAAIPHLLATAAKTPRTDGAMDDHEFLNIAHRGASGYAPENTIPAFELAVNMGAKFIELDLQMTKDGHIVVMHDNKVNRTTNGKGYVRNKTLSELKQLDAGSWFNQSNSSLAKVEYIGIEVPTLEEVFEALGKKTKYYIETKSPEEYPGMEEKLLSLLDKFDLTNGHVVIQSFSKKSLRNIHALEPSIPLIQLVSQPNLAIQADRELKAIRRYAVGVGPNFKRMNSYYVKKAKANGLLVHPYTVNSERDISKALKWNVDGIFSNYPDRVQEIIASE
ncbi:glycerophosphodiester phosphodiesterase [Bacillus alkalicellulosilyticus]|uniref:glycerophosphodiester phosphodiesterase n=1 Tax=Alkalihalobacterium alkalicellulosilyticum TaxID=1912214 RepID=UPI000998B212|nr:glycerophosphodiester phosphodiesterase [Bacillus alkalicellulosilyticus]